MGTMTFEAPGKPQMTSRDAILRIVQPEINSACGTTCSISQRVAILRARRSFSSIDLVLIDLMQQLHGNSCHSWSDLDVDLNANRDNAGELANRGGVRLRLHFIGAEPLLEEPAIRGKPGATGNFIIDSIATR